MNFKIFDKICIVLLLLLNSRLTNRQFVWISALTASAAAPASIFGILPSFTNNLVAAKVAFIAGFGDSVGVKLRDVLQTIIGGRSWTNGLDAGYILCDSESIGKRLHHHHHLPSCVHDSLIESNVTGSLFKESFVITNFMVHDLAENPMSMKDIDSNLYRTWYHYNALAITAKKNGQNLRRIYLGPLALNVSEDKRKFIELFNSRAKLILVDDENGGFELLDAYNLTLTEMNGQFLTSLKQPEVDNIIIPSLRDMLIKIILKHTSRGEITNATLNTSTNSTLFPSSDLTSYTSFVEQNGTSNGHFVVPAIPSPKSNLVLPCLSTDTHIKKSSPGWSHIEFSICPQQITDEANNLTAKVPIYSEREPVKGEWNPKVETAVVFSTAKPHFVVVTPMFNVDSYAARNVFATIKATTGIWALDIVLDTCVDDTAKAVYNMLLNYLVYYNHTGSYSHMCSLLCSGRRQSRPSSVFEPSACTSASTLTRIRVITSDSTLLETRAENLAFASSDVETAFYASVQADMLVTEKGWNFYLSLPLWVWSGEVSSAGTKDALNIPYRKDESDRNFSRRILFPAYVNRFDIQETDKFVVRDIANRGPLIFNGTKMRALGFFNERQFWLEDDDTEFHVRAFYQFGWITGYFPAGHATVQRNRKDSRPHALVKSHKDIESMRVKILNSLRAHANHSYRDGFCDNFPHNNHVRHVSREAVVAAMERCAWEMAAQSGFCPLHCHTGG